MVKCVCGNVFQIKDEDITFKNHKRNIKCNVCGKNFEVFNQDYSKYERLDNGQLIRKDGKKKMKKKARLKLRKYLIESNGSI